MCEKLLYNLDHKIDQQIVMIHSLIWGGCMFLLHQMGVMNEVVHVLYVMYVELYYLVDVFQDIVALLLLLFKNGK